MAQNGVEVRRLHIVYFLSRKGCMEHPHLIRVHHLSKNGVRLRDIKRWLGELRGKDLPESFAWSYKRRYKTGYVWQDLLDDDLVTPISDNEYVLKGSEISSTTHNADFSISEKKFAMQKEQSSLEESSKDNLENQSHSSEIEESSPTFGSEKSTITDDSSEQKHVLNKNSSAGTIKQEAKALTFHSTVVFDNTNKRRIKFFDEKSTISARTASSDKHDHTSKSCSNGASNIFRNLITCGAVDTNDSALVVANKQNRGHQRNNYSEETCKREKIGGSQIMFATQHQWSRSKSSCDGLKDSAKRKGQFREQSVPCAAYKPLNGPICSQCGKTFKPEKLHAHMKYCKGMKALAKASKPANAISAAAENTTQISTKSKNKDSVSGYLLAH